MKELINAKAEIICEGNWQPLHEAAKAGHNEIIKLLLDAGCDVKNPSKCMSSHNAITYSLSRYYGRETKQKPLYYVFVQIYVTLCMDMVHE